MRALVFLSLLTGSFSSAALAKVPDALTSEALAKCTAKSLDDAAKCLNDHLAEADLSALRVDRQFDPDVYQAISTTWNLADPNSPLSVGLRSQGLDHVALAPAIIIAAAQARQKGERFDIEPFRVIVAQLTEGEKKARAEWRPPLRKGATLVDLSQCPNLPAKGHPRAACVKQPDGTLVVAKPLWEPEDPVRGN
jgi:hypothetical protein